MSLINCSECGNEVSDKAKCCPKCGAPIILSQNNKKIQIKLTAQSQNYAFKATQNVEIYDMSNKNLIWKGISGQIIELDIDKPITLKVKYLTSFKSNLWGGTAECIINPEKWTKYSISIKKGIFTNIVLVPVDVFDSD